MHKILLLYLTRSKRINTHITGALQFLKQLTELDEIFLEKLHYVMLKMFTTGRNACIQTFVKSAASHRVSAAEHVLAPVVFGFGLSL